MMVTGQRELQATPSAACSAAMPMASRVIPIFVVMYATCPGFGSVPMGGEQLTMWPHRCATMCGSV